MGVELRHAEKTGAEWDGFRVESVDLHKVTDTRSECEKAFDAFDLDHDNVIRIEEVIEYLLSVKQHQRPKGLEDINPFQKAKVRKRLQTMDTNKDGTLSYQEFQTW